MDMLINNAYRKLAQEVILTAVNDLKLSAGYAHEIKSFINSAWGETLAQLAGIENFDKIKNEISSFIGRSDFVIDNAELKQAIIEYHGVIPNIARKFGRTSKQMAMLIFTRNLRDFSHAEFEKFFEQEANKQNICYVSHHVVTGKTHEQIKAKLAEFRKQKENIEE